MEQKIVKKYIYYFAYLFNYILEQIIYRLISLIFLNLSSLLYSYFGNGNGNSARTHQRLCLPWHQACIVDPQKESSFFSGLTPKALPPPPWGLMAIFFFGGGDFFQIFFELQKRYFFLVARPLRKEIFAASLSCFCGKCANFSLILSGCCCRLCCSEPVLKIYKARGI